ncbi:hypothetical protein L1887_58427 [Cichorium endivia]|nr:hypothetical protein L1887_58427 [Cichorium endivia]
MGTDRARKTITRTEVMAVPAGPWQTWLMTRHVDERMWPTSFFMLPLSTLCDPAGVAMSYRDAGSKHGRMPLLRIQASSRSRAPLFGRSPEQADWNFLEIVIDRAVLRRRPWAAQTHGSVPPDGANLHLVLPRSHPRTARLSCSRHPPSLTITSHH